jgi:hypothetical protein
MDVKKSNARKISEVRAKLGKTGLIKTEIKHTPEKHNSVGVANESENRLMSSPTLREIAKVGTAEAGMLGLMDQFWRVLWLKST